MGIRRKTRLGTVISNKMNKTVVVEVEVAKRHPLYKKTIKRTIKYKAHCENNDCGMGDVVRIIETRPLSKEKRWRVSEIVTKAAAIEIKPEEVV